MIVPELEAARRMDEACRELAWWTLPVAPPEDLMEAARQSIREYRRAADRGSEPEAEAIIPVFPSQDARHWYERGLADGRHAQELSGG